MQAVFDVLSQIGEFFTTIFELVVKLVEDIIYIVKLITNIVPNLSSFFGWLPTTCVTILVVTFGVVVIYQILGRE